MYVDTKDDGKGKEENGDKREEEEECQDGEREKKKLERKIIKKNVCTQRDRNRVRKQVG